MQENSVLIVDDEPIVRESIRDWLKDTGYQVLTAETGEEALEMIERQDFSIMVLDIRLPGKTGITVLKEVKAQRPWIKSVIITAYPSAETTDEAMKLGAVDYLIKPIAPEDLERLIQETLSSVGREPTVTTEVEIRPKPPAAEVVEVKKSFVITKSHASQRHTVTKVKLLLADKSEIFCEGLAKLMEREPSIEVECVCCTGLEVIESACEHQPDVILIGIELSECGGIEAMQHIHERLPKTSIILLTNSEANGDLLSAVKTGIRAYISKDISVENLIKTITLVADGEVIVSPPMAARLLAEFSLVEEYKDATKLREDGTLSKREQAVLALVAQGLTNREVATSLFISEHTAKVHVRNIMGKMHAHTRQQAVALARGKAV